MNRLIRLNDICHIHLDGALDKPMPCEKFVLGLHIIFIFSLSHLAFYSFILQKLGSSVAEGLLSR